jgi:RNA polymerase sigma-70 factor, ECF subfamily
MTIVDRRDTTTIGALESRQLVQRALQGCEEAFQELTERYRSRLTHLITKRLSGSLADAEDVVQEAFFRAHRNLSQFNPSFQFSTWLYTIAIRLSNDRGRANRRELRKLESFAQQSTVGQSRAEPLQSAEEIGRIWKRARQVLNPSQYTAMWLRYGEELPLGEVAKAMAKSQVGVRVLLHRARLNMLKQKWESS